MTISKTNTTLLRVICCVCLTILSCFYSNTSTAQELPCANEIFHTQQLKDTAFVRQLRDLRQQANNVPQQRINGAILEIPIVVHVLHLGEPIGTGTNISDQQIYDAVQGANERWRRMNTTESVDMEVQFCLAQFDPEGNPVNGIVRKDASGIPNYSQYGISYIGAFGEPGSDEIATKNFSNWPHNYVYNIWVVNKIAGNWGGYAFFPVGGEYSTDGVVIVANSMKYIYSTLAHELGHGMSLFHTFQGDDGGNCPANDLCFIQGDWICDTPPHRQSDCNNSSCNNSPDSLYSMKNIMSYCNARGMFTQGQKDRVRTSIFNTSRKQLLFSHACIGTATDISRTVKTNDPLNLYPNPGNGNFTIFTQINPNESATLEIINTIGQTLIQADMYTGKEHHFSFSGQLPKGIYQVLIRRNTELRQVGLLSIL